MKSLRWAGTRDRGLFLCASSVAAALALGATASTAEASSAIDSPDSGVVQSGRGGAWFVRGDDPLAAYFNPAALAFQTSGVHLGAQLMFMNKCFTRLGPDGKPVSPGNNLTGPGAEGGPPAATCAEGGVFPNPQIAATFRITDKLAIGLAVLGPHASGHNKWAETLPFVNQFGVDAEQPTPGRYMLIEADSKILFPTLSVGFAPRKDLAIGAGFVWGVALVEFVNFTEALSPEGAATANSDQFEKNGDVRAKLNATDLFVPGFVLSGLWSPTERLDVAGWFKWQDAVRSATDLHTESLYWKAGGAKNDEPCKDNPKGDDCNLTEALGKGTLKFSIPAEAKLGLRYHHPREGGPRPAWAKSETRKVRDPMSQDLFDVEVNFTYANNSIVDVLELRFQKGIAVNGTPAFAPENGDVPHHWKDVMGIRLGGDFVPLQNRLALRAGGFFETKGQSDEYLNIDFDVAEKIGVAGGATVRLGPVDVSASFQHTFYGTIDNGGKGALHGLSGDASGCGTPIVPKPGCYQTRQPINGGVLKASLNEFGISGTLRY